MVQEDAASCRLRSNRKAGGITPHGAHGGQSKPREDGDDEAPPLKKMKKDKTSKKTKKPKMKATATTEDASINDLEREALRLLAV